jgi:hypothetical protein
MVKTVRYKISKFALVKALTVLYFCIVKYD